MPIARRAFELGANVRDWMKEIHDFLAQHKDEAFTMNELREQWDIDVCTEVGVSLVFKDALEHLVEQGAVERKSIEYFSGRYDVFYIYRNPLNL